LHYISFDLSDKMIYAPRGFTIALAFLKDTSRYATVDD